MTSLLHGVFFQNHTQLGVAFVPIEGTASVIHKGVCQFMYMGAIWRDPRNTSAGFTGHMQDVFGQAELSEVVISLAEIRFVKTYEERKGEPIRFVFRKKNGNVWIGEYVGERVGTGVSLCVMTEVDDRFFTLKFAMRLLRRKRDHFWPEHP